MRISWKVGRVAGIDLYIHPSFLLVFAFPFVREGGVLSVLLVLTAFGCVLLHELGHALMARRFGIETKDITLYPIGGVARLTRMPRSPGAEPAIALAGPAVNVGIVAVLALLLGSGIFSSLSGPSPLETFLNVLLWMNVVLAVFNLVPAFPMDGGRVLRALLSGWLGRARATMIAAAIGRGLALCFGLYWLFYGGLGAESLVRMALAAFIYVAAGAELSRVLAEERYREEDAQGVWTAPPGFRWVSVGQGVWQLAPVSVHVSDRNASPWR